MVGDEILQTYRGVFKHDVLLWQINMHIVDRIFCIVFLYTIKKFNIPLCGPLCVQVFM